MRGFVLIIDDFNGPSYSDFRKKKVVIQSLTLIKTFSNILLHFFYIKLKFYGVLGFWGFGV